MRDLSDLPPLPLIEEPPTASGYGRVPIDQNDPRGSEPLVDLLAFGLAGEPYYARTDGDNAPYNTALSGAIPYLLARRSVAESLLAVDTWLAPYGVALFLWDAYRPPAVQQGLWDFHAAERRRSEPEIAEDDLDAELRRYISDPHRFDPKDATTWPAHSTGGAVDLTLFDPSDGTLLPMGADFDEMGAASHSDFFECATLRGDVPKSDPRLLNRRLLFAAMGTQGFVNYPHEFWHFDLGTQMGSWNRAHLENTAPKPAFYGYVALPSAFS
ncbi:MAG: M15 family metallopeptidase [Pseudomonadota bacterium]